jgi:gamma-glutamyltranspeptidase/glutathione hydrolase
MPIKRLVEPAAKLAREGVVINKFQGEVLKIIQPIFLSTKGSRSVFGRNDNSNRLKSEGDLQRMPDFADFIELLASEGEGLFYRGEFADQVDNLCRERGGFLRKEDFKAYQVKKRKPLHLHCMGADMYLNPPPSSGGILVAFALKLFSSVCRNDYPKTDADWAILFALLQEATEKARVDGMARNSDSGLNQILDSATLELYRKEVMAKKESFRGTTHISIIDGEGNAASLTSSNGEGSGLMVSGTNIMLNNMLGEEDLNPDGFHRWEPNSRMTSMMTPGMAEGRDGELFAFGSGGSTRIRTAILQLLVHIFQRKMSVQEAVMAPRVHAESGMVHIESGLNRKTVEELKAYFPNHRCWDRKSLFFGGTHVSEKRGKTFYAVGDPRRGGVSIVL